jgi:hypothetical protein
MKTRRSGKRFLITMVALLLAIPAFGHDQKKHPDRAMIEKMEAVPCGAKEHGMTGLGSVWASVGVTSVNSEEKLCPQYLLRSDDMEYHVRPLDHKHPVILPIGKEAEFKVSKDKFDMRIADGDRKMRHYQVVAMKPIDHSDTSASEASKYNAPRNDYVDKPLADQNASKAPVQPNDRPLQPNDHPQ